MSGVCCWKNDITLRVCESMYQLVCAMSKATASSDLNQSLLGLAATDGYPVGKSGRRSAFPMRPIAHAGRVALHPQGDPAQQVVGHRHQQRYAQDFPQTPYRELPYPMLAHLGIGPFGGCAPLPVDRLAL